MTRLALAVLLVAAGVACWSAAGITDALATRHERLATLQNSGDFEAFEGWASIVAQLIDANADQQWASVLYWTRGYEPLAAPVIRQQAAEATLLSANAAFRIAQREAAARPIGVERLDEVLQAYATVLKNGAFDPDAAYNYEYVARLRDTLARTRPGARPPETMPAIPPAADDLPSGPTIHGRPGMHPPATRGEDFEVITPMDYGDREAQPEPTPGRKLPRKG